MLVSSGDTLLGSKYYRVANKLDYKNEIPIYIKNWRSKRIKDSNISVSIEDEISMNHSKNKATELNSKNQIKKDSVKKKDVKTEITIVDINASLPVKKTSLYPLKIVGPQGQRWLENQQGKRITRNFDIIKLINNKYFAISKYQQWGALDTLGNVMLPMQFESFRDLNNMIGN